ncbi:unnamed protein product [Rotaria sordida]|uniref:Neurotransmitter-gated ion-channel ligand-binding domain-containing protein n=1 Tax=Rotaria sordida TaxID=392033 RepID=A0A814XTW8_9BILA|nr:unnamed protein product [Rotaria sordida]
MAQQSMKIYYVFILFYLLNSTFGGSYQRRLLQDLFAEKQHDKLERASIDNSVAVSVDIGFNLLQIMDFDEKNQVLTTNGILSLIWDDNRMIWEPADYGNITKIVVPSTKIWIPEILLYNSVDEEFDSLRPTNVSIVHTGSIMYVTQKIFKSSCSLNITSVPLNNQRNDIQK